ncbi:MAG: type II toxin-antitoxin system VapC family toxin [Candidatus Dormibacteraeota bacterium]|nr:type II toxin-antitoxin system VapC family toxin [Candidatus Dormibacteraeota bacterium]
MIVVDASVLAPALADDGQDGDESRTRLRAQVLVAPELIDLDVVSVFRRLLFGGQLPARRARLALADLTHLPLRRTPHRPLLSRCWELRANLSIYDAAYIALAETLDIVLVTADARLSRAPGLRCQVELLGDGR